MIKFFNCKINFCNWKIFNLLTLNLVSNNSHLDDKALNDLTTKARKQLEVNEKLEKENFSLQITLDLYNNIASSIENGIVSAI